MVVVRSSSHGLLWSLKVYSTPRLLEETAIKAYVDHSPLEQVVFFRGAERGFLAQVAMQMAAAVYPPAELVPLNNPYELSVGDEIALRVMVDGKPVQQQLVLAGGVRDGKLFDEREDRSDGEGVVRFTLDESGRWYAKFINMVKTDAEDIDYESKWATISFEVR